MEALDSDMLRPHEGRIQAYIERHCPKVRLSSPCKLPVKLNNGGYRTESFIGEEEFEVTAIYFSEKTDRALFVARPVRKTPRAKGKAGWTFVEFTLEQAKSHAIGFESLLEGALDIAFDTLAEEHAQAERKARVAEMATGNEVYQQHYGSW